MEAWEFTRRHTHNLCIHDEFGVGKSPMKEHTDIHLLITGMDVTGISAFR